MRIAIIGSRGYPYVYGGYETFVRELSERLVQKGISVHVYNQKHLFPERPSSVNGINLHYIPTVSSKSLNQLVHSFFSIVHASCSKADVLLVLNLAAGPMGWIPKLFGKKTMINTDGLEWKRPKWKGLGAKYFYFGAWSASKLYDKIITDAEAMRQVYLDEFKTPSTVIAYGAPSFKPAAEAPINQWNLKNRGYYLIVGRLVPDNNADMLIEEFLRSDSQKKLVVVGDVPYNDEYVQRLKGMSNDRVLFTGYVNDQQVLMSLYQHCFAYFHGHEFGGTNPAMLKAMSNHCAIIALDTPFNREMLDEGRWGILFQKGAGELASCINKNENKEEKLNELRDSVAGGLTQKYDWDSITNQYIAEFRKLRADRG